MVVPVVVKQRLCWCNTREHHLVFTTKSFLKYAVLNVKQLLNNLAEIRYVNLMTTSIIMKQEIANNCLTTSVVHAHLSLVHITNNGVK